MCVDSGVPLGIGGRSAMLPKASCYIYMCVSFIALLPKCLGKHSFFSSRHEFPFYRHGNIQSCELWNAKLKLYPC